ncbi:hypothetical protein CDV31_007697 [Fusarium ambrosium]|uniref:CHCH domain-containing protein n=1 Tax=Fusarium ambrosium TaxID=131363 RepID=A0A428U539_9HYPO|nr:hypothetical protein CDV31_007697 [Fusarium ambrosium]
MLRLNKSDSDKAGIFSSCRAFVMLRGCRVKSKMVAFVLGYLEIIGAGATKTKLPSLRPISASRTSLAPHSDQSQQTNSVLTLSNPSRTTSHSHSRLWNHRNVRRPEAQNIGTMSTRRPQFNQQVLIDTAPLPDDIPAVKEVGASSAPLLSASFFIGARCRDYNDDYMQCKNENPGRGELECLKEGRRVTRCASSVIQDINTHCLAEFRKHWECLDDRNHQLWQCRPAEWKLNKCVFDNLKLEKKVPDQPTNVTPVHLRPKQIFADVRIGPGDGKPFIPGQEEAKQ